MKKLLSIFILLTIVLNTSAQEEPKTTYKFFDIRPNKGKIFGSFGWHGAKFSKSDIHFRGADYDFTLKDVIGVDKPEEFSFELYFGPTKFTIPHYNFKFGYFIKENYFIAFNIDHLKYVMKPNQVGTIDGYIKNSGTKYDKTYDNEEFIISPDFLQFEHTDGLNYLNLEVNRFDNLLKFVNLENKWIGLNLNEGISAGVVIPKTNATLLNNPRNDQFYFSGLGFSANVDLSVTFLQYFYIQYGLKTGYIDLPSVRTTSSPRDFASHSFWFLQYGGMFGFRFNISK